MADGIPDVDDLRRKSEVSDDGIEAATAAYLADQDAKAFALESCPMIDVATAIEMHPKARKRVADAATMPGLRCTMVQTAVVTSDEVPPRRWRGGEATKLIARVWAVAVTVCLRRSANGKPTCRRYPPCKRTKAGFAGRMQAADQRKSPARLSRRG